MSDQPLVNIYSFNGILFINSRRQLTFNSSFHIPLLGIHCEDPSPHIRREIWILYLKNARSRNTNIPSNAGIGITKVELDKLSRLRLNGLQIRNVVRVAEWIISGGKDRRKKKLTFKLLKEVYDSTLQVESDARYVHQLNWASSIDSLVIAPVTTTQCFHRCIAQFDDDLKIVPSA